MNAEEPLTGTRLADRYVVVEPIAGGGMSRVFRGRDERLERDVALKVMAEPYASNPAFVERFLGEARAAAGVTHPNLLHVYDSGSDGPLHFIAMELLDRHRPLREILRERGHLSVSEALAVGRDILAGLQTVHGHGLVHCDVTTANVLLGPGPAKLIDFGISRVPMGEAIEAAVRDATAAGERADGSARDGGEASPAATSMGSLHYMSPEQLRGERLGPPSDLFAVGVVLYESLTGRLPYEGRTPRDVAEAQAAQRVRPPSTLVDGIPARLDAAVLQALRYEPAARFVSAEAMLHALEASTLQRDEEETRVVPTVADADAGSGYVPPRAPPPDASRPADLLSEPRGGPPFKATESAPQRSRWSGLGAALLLGAAAIVTALIVVPILLLGRSAEGGAGTPTSPSPPAATASPAPGLVAVPETVGLGKEDAIAAATAAGLEWIIRCAEDPSAPEGIVDQEPQAGTQVAPGSRFTMYSARIADCR